MMNSGNGSRIGNYNRLYGLGSINNRGLKYLLPQSNNNRGQNIWRWWHFWNFI